MAVAVGFALAWLAVPTVGKRVFLLAVSTIPTVMHGMTPAATTVKKAVLGRSKSPPLAVKKHLLVFPYFISISIKNTVISFLYRRSRTFFTANGGFFYHGHCWRHAWHDGGDGGDETEENLFSDGRHHRHHQGEAASSCSGFLYFVVTLFNIRGCGICHWPADFSAAVTPSANRNTYSVATLFCINTQGRGASPLNPGLCNRNSYRVARGAYHPQCANHT